MDPRVGYRESHLTTPRTGSVQSVPNVMNQAITITGSFTLWSVSSHFEASQRRPAGHRWSRRSGRGARMSGAVLASAGLITTVIASFLPWLTSGGVLRNSYASVGVFRRLGLAGSGFSATALSFWPLLGPVVMIAVIAGILRWWRTAAVLTLLVGAVTGGLAGGVLAVAGGSRTIGVGLAFVGPVWTVLGAAAAVAGAITVLIGARRRNSPSRALEPVPPIGIVRPPAPLPEPPQPRSPGYTDQAQVSPEPYAAAPRRTASVAEQARLEWSAHATPARRAPEAPRDEPSSPSEYRSAVKREAAR